MSYLTRQPRRDWPSFTVIGPNCKVSGADLLGQKAGALGAAHDPFRLDSFSFDDGFKVPPSIEPLGEIGSPRLTDRRRLLADLD